MSVIDMVSLNCAEWNWI